MKNFFKGWQNVKERFLQMLHLQMRGKWGEVRGAAPGGVRLGGTIFEKKFLVFMMIDIIKERVRAQR